ncbi:MAG: carboxymuconolactone decarboxylase family protein [Gammaproteobacteria bacterium]|nr:carboxymuconolactone decarboxylase family protein [Gammaproteobacteria bacterium]
MSPRLDFYSAAPNAIEILLEQENNLRRQFSNEHPVTITTWELVKLRVSQINQCGYCIDMHSKNALKNGEKSERIVGLSAWRDTPLYTQREQKALAWAELVVSNHAISADEYAQAVNEFGETGLTELTIAINAINSWNRISKAFKPEVGSYQPS